VLLQCRIGLPEVFIRLKELQALLFKKPFRFEAGAALTLVPGTTNQSIGRVPSDGVHLPLILIPIRQGRSR
jgi:hypothetical protein